MSGIVKVTFGDGDMTEQLFMLKVCALKNHDEPALWRLTDQMMELLLGAVHVEESHKWPHGFVTPNRLFGVPVDFVHDMPHLLCEDYVIYPYTVRTPQVWHA